MLSSSYFLCVCIFILYKVKNFVFIIIIIVVATLVIVVAAAVVAAAAVVVVVVSRHSSSWMLLRVSFVPLQLNSWTLHSLWSRDQLAVKSRRSNDVTQNIQSWQQRFFLVRYPSNVNTQCFHPQLKLLKSLEKLYISMFSYEWNVKLLEWKVKLSDRVRTGRQSWWVCWYLNVGKGTFVKCYVEKLYHITLTLLTLQFSVKSLFHRYRNGITLRWSFILITLRW